MKSEILLLYLLGLINAAGVPDGFICNLTEGCENTASKCCTYKNKSGSGEGDYNGMYCQDYNQQYLGKDYTFKKNGVTLTRVFCPGLTNAVNLTFSALISILVVV